MNRAVGFYRSTIGRKIVMALSGVVWVGYVVAHMLGNLQIFAGPETINGYSAKLHAMPELLWTARLVLVAALVAHVATSVSLTQTNLSARPVGYAKKKDVATTYAARTMIWSGPILFLFILYHVAHLTLHVTPNVPLDPHDVYGNLVTSFQVPWLVALYTVAQVALGLHLYHGAWSFLQTLGANHPQLNPLRRAFATLVTVAVIGGFLSVPYAVLAGVVKPVDRHAAVSR